jgi:hypothetical protein
MSQETMRFPIRPRELHDSAKSSTRRRGVPPALHPERVGAGGRLRSDLLARFLRRKRRAA